MSGRFISPIALSALRHEQEVFNARLKRGEIPDAHNIAATYQIVCGCSYECCCFISVRRHDDEERYAKQRAETDAWVAARDRAKERARRAAEKAAQPVWAA